VVSRTLPERGWSRRLLWLLCEAQEDPWEVVDPVLHGAAGAEGVLQAALEAFYYPFGLWVVGSGLVVLDVECPRNYATTEFRLFFLIPSIPYSVRN
jgi:hypothetical protein